jgi:penicillin amidase
MAAIHDVAGSILKAGLTWLGRRRLPQTDGELTLPGLAAPVEVIRDRWGVPHMYAANAHDLFFAQGFVHAQDRLWQMELNRRAASGRLSEMLGAAALETDRATRTFGFHRLAQADWAVAEGDGRATILAYSAGVNAFLRNPSAAMPIEFTLLGHTPEPWEPEDTLAYSRLMIWQLSHAWYSEIVRAQLIEAVGQEHASELEITYPPGNPITLPDGIRFNRLDPDGSLAGARGPFLNRGQGSNAWAISGAKTVSGKPFLCNDMHLPLALPSLWYENHLVADGINVSGVSLPGMPLVMVGHNARIAWGMTLAFTDCEDLFVEKFDPQIPGRYQLGGEWLDARVIAEPIRIKGRAEPHVEQVVITHHGPIVSDVVGHPEQRIALNSMALRPGLIIAGWLQLDRAGDWDEFVTAMRTIEAPQLSVTYADVDGNVGFWVTGKVPVRAKGEGMVPAPGWTGEYEWIGEVPFEEMPHALNPEPGYVVTCNHRIISDAYPHFLGNAWMNGFRARRVTDLIASKDRLSADDFRAIQLDFTCLPGLELVKRLAGLTSDDPDVQAALELLRAWDGKLTAESAGGAVYEVTRHSLIRALLEPGLGVDLTTRLMGHGFHPLMRPLHEFYGHDTVAMLRLLDAADSWWVAGAGGREAVLARSLKQAMEWLRGKLGPDPAGWRWGKLHRAVFAHALGRQQPLDRVFDRGPLPMGGDTDTPCQTASAPDPPYETVVAAPSFRQIVDMGDLSRSLIIHPPGQSGQLGSPHYDDLADLWIKGEYHPMLWTREQVEQAAEARLILSQVPPSPQPSPSKEEGAE